MRRFPQYKYPLKLDVGCGEFEKKGYLGIDNRDCGFNMIWDMRDGFPFPDNSIDEIFTAHFIEHLDDNESEEFIRDAMRVLKPHGGVLIVRCPHASSTGACFMGHKTFWNEDKVEALLRMSNPLGKFLVIENVDQNTELHFTLKKL